MSNSKCYIKKKIRAQWMWCADQSRLGCQLQATNRNSVIFKKENFPLHNEMSAAGAECSMIVKYWISNENRNSRRKKEQRCRSVHGIDGYSWYNICKHFVKTTVLNIILCMCLDVMSFICLCAITGIQRCYNHLLNLTCLSYWNQRLNSHYGGKK